MLINMIKAKIHRAVVTERNIDYQGSIAIDRDLLDQAGILPNEAVLVADVNNGTRHTTYAIAAERGSGMVMVNGAAARLVEQGDTVIIMCFAMMTPEEARTHKPTVLLMDGQSNKVKEIVH